MRSRWAVAGLVVAAAAVLAIAYGVPYGSNNQLTYLLAPLQQAHPELYRHDWLIAQTTNYHPVFAYLAAPLYAIDARGVVGFGLAQLVVMTATYAVIYRLVAATTDDKRVPIYIALAGLLALGGGRALAGSYLFAGYLQPSSLATLGWLVAMVALARDRLVVAGIALACAGAVHANFLFLGIALFGAAELATTRRFDLRRLAIAWALKPRTEAIARLWRFAVIGVVACLGAVIVCSIPPLLGFTKLYVWRVAPFAQLACVVIAFAGIGGVRELPRARVIALVLGAAVVVYEGFHLQSTTYGGALAFAAVATLASAWLRQVALVPALAVAMYGAAVETHRDELTDPPVFAPDCGGPDCAMFEAVGKTPVDSVFVVPPYMGYFRLIGRRAVVVDSQSPPLVPDELVAWYRRMLAVVASTEDIRTYEQVEQRWDTLTADQLVAIARGFSADYLVLDKGRTLVRPALPVVFENDGRVIYRVKD